MIRRLITRLDEPHPRHTRTVRDAVVRAVAWPVIAMSVTVTLIGFTQPERLNGEPPPVRTVEVGTR